MPGPDGNHDDPSMNHPGGHAPSFAQTPRPAMDHDHDHESPSRDEAAARRETDGDDLAPEGPGLFRTLLNLASKLPWPSLGTERHEQIEPPHHLVSAEGAQAPPAETPELVPARLSSFLLRREARIPIAALLSLVLLVGAILGGKRTPEPAKDSKQLTLAIPPTAEEKDAKDKGKETDKLDPGTAPSKAEATVPPEPATVASGPSTNRELADADKVARPPKPDDSPKRGSLDGPSTATTPPLPPDPLIPKPPESPQGPSDPLPVEMLPTLGANPSPMPTPELPKPADEARPKEAEAPPAQPSGLPSIGDPSSLVPPTTPDPAEPPRMTPTPEPSPSPSPSPDPAPPPPSAGPILTEKPPTLERVPAAIESSATKASLSSSLGPGWSSPPSGGRRLVGAVPIVSTPAEARIDPPRVAESPRVSDDSSTADQVEPVVHVVQPGENFWTISKLYYHTGRFYKALHAANRKQVPDIASLWVGTVLRIPPPEALDRKLIEPASRPAPGEPSPSIVSRTSKKSEPEDADLAMPPRRRAVPTDPEAAPAPRKLTYQVKDYETLRSIARDTLDDPKRDRDIFNLNREILESPNDPIPAGTTLTLPADATVGRRLR